MFLILKAVKCISCTPIILLYNQMDTNTVIKLKWILTVVIKPVRKAG